MARSLNIDIPEKLLPVFTTKDRFIDLYGGRGSAKSWTVADFLIIKGYQQKKRILCTREIQNTIKDSVYRLLSDKINEFGLDVFYDIKADSIIGKNGTEFIFKGLLRNPQDIKSMEGIDYCWVEEAHSVSKKSLEILIPTIREENSQIIFTYNPTNEDDPVHVNYTLSNRPNVLRIECNYNDNPFFPDVLKEEMEYDRANDPDKFEHIWCGKCVKHSHAQVFYGKWGVEDFEIPEDVFFYQGADWGFSQDPLAFIRCFVVDRKLYICDELYGIGIDIDFIPSKFGEIFESNKYPITADSSRPDTINYVKRHGFPLIRKSIKGKGSVEDGIAFLRSFEKIIIHPKCKHTISEFRLYQYKIDPKTEAISNKLEDKNNHCFIGNTLILTNKGNVKIKDIKVGDLVKTRNGYNRVLKIFNNGIKEVKEYNFGNKKSLMSTATHNIITQFGKKYIKDISSNDILYFWSSFLCKVIKSQNTKRSYLKACLIDVIQIAKEEQTGYITKHPSEKMVKIFVNICMLLNINQDMVQSQKDFMFIIKMKILLIMKLIIWKYFLIKNIYQIIQKNIMKITKIKLKNIWRILDFLLKDGIVRKKEESGIANMLKKQMLKLRKRYSLVNIAKKNIYQNQMGYIDFVQLNAKCHSIENKKEIVYNLMIENEHEYFANGILVSNCIDSLRYSLEDLMRLRKVIAVPGLAR